MFRLKHKPYDLTVQLFILHSSMAGAGAFKTLLRTVRSYGLCFKRNIVYQLTCNNCHAIYIGSTVRALHTRVSEHLRRSNSAIYRHQIECFANYSISVLATAVDAKDLRFKEAILIRRLRPTLNRREEFVDVESLTAGIDIHGFSHSRITSPVRHSA